MRSEPEGRTGFAHLFEHLMFQGSANLGKTEHFTYVQGAGGYLNGSTHIDYTNYYEVLPSSATELALFLEADRMRSVALSQDNLDNQVAVVQNEIRVNVQNRPYGGFPWLSIPPLLYRRPSPTRTTATARSSTSRPRPSRTRRASSTATTHRATPSSRSPATSTPPRSCAGSSSTSATSRAARSPKRAVLPRAAAHRGAARHHRATTLAPDAGHRDRLAHPRPRRPRRLPALRRARRGADRRRRRRGCRSGCC